MYFEDDFCSDNLISLAQQLSNRNLYRHNSPVATATLHWIHFKQEDTARIGYTKSEKMQSRQDMLDWPDTAMIRKIRPKKQNTFMIDTVSC